MDECSEQHFKESVTDIVEHWIGECDSGRLVDTHKN